MFTLEEKQAIAVIKRLSRVSIEVAKINVKLEMMKTKNRECQLKGEEDFYKEEDFKKLIESLNEL